MSKESSAPKGRPAPCIICNETEESIRPDGTWVACGRGAISVLCGNCTQVFMRQTGKIPWDRNIKDIQDNKESKYKRLN